MGAKSLLLWHCSWCLVVLLTRAAAFEGGQGDAGLVARKGVRGGDGDGDGGMVTPQAGNATLAKYSEKQKRPRWEISLPPRRTFAYKAVPDDHFNQDDGSEGDLVSGDETKRDNNVHYPIN